MITRFGHELISSTTSHSDGAAVAVKVLVTGAQIGAVVGLVTAAFLAWAPNSIPKKLKYMEHLPAVGLISGTSLLTLAACIIYYKAAASAAVLLLAFVAILYSDELGACGGWALHHCAGVLASVRRGAPRAPFGPPAAPASESGACCRDVELRVIMNPRPGPQIP